MALIEVTPEILVASGDVTLIGAAELEQVKRMALASPSGRARICAHQKSSDALHEMLIAMGGGRYVRPHAHYGKSESFHMVEGELTIVLFANDGRIQQLVDLSATGAQSLYYRLSSPTVHTVVLRTALAVFHETTNGPFRPSDAYFPAWSPDERNTSGASVFLERLLVDIDKFRRRVVS